MCNTFAEHPMGIDRYKFDEVRGTPIPLADNARQISNLCFAGTLILLEKSHILSNMLLKKSHMLLKKSNSAPESSTSTNLEVLIIQDRQLNGGSYDGVVLGTCA